MECIKCGRKMRQGKEQVGLENKVAVYNTFAYCDNCRRKVNLDALKRERQPKKNSILSIWACVLALFGCTSFMALILALVDLCKNEKDKKHIGSWFAIVVFAVYMAIGIFAIPGIDSGIKEEAQKWNDKKEMASDSKDRGEKENEENSTKFSYNDADCEFLECKIEEDEFGEERLVLYFEFKNNSNENQAFGYLFSTKVFQNGVELDSSWIHVNEETRNSEREIQKGTTITVAEAFSVGESRENIKIEIAPFSAWSDKKIFEKEVQIKQK